MSFTESQNRALSIIPHVTGPFSFLGSAWILYDILKDRRKWSKPYHRLLFSMCVFDAFSSIALGLSTWPIPSTSNAYAALGNTHTCTTQAFFIQANIASPIFNFMLSLYFLLLTKYNVTEDRMKQRVEPMMLTVTVGFAIGTSIVCLALGLFQDSSLWCWINATPKGCDQSYNSDETTCTKGDNAELFRWAFFFIPLWASVIGTMITMGVLWHCVRKQEATARKWKFRAAVAAALNDSGETSTTSATSISGSLDPRAAFSRRAELKRRESVKAYRKSSMVARQALRYVAVFYVTWLAGTTNRLLQLTLGHSYFWIMALHAFFTPMQGFFNWIVYMRPRFKVWYRDYKRKETMLGLAAFRSSFGSLASFGSSLARHLHSQRHVFGSQKQIGIQDFQDLYDCEDGEEQRHTDRESIDPVTLSTIKRQIQDDLEKELDGASPACDESLQSTSNDEDESMSISMIRRQLGSIVQEVDADDSSCLQTLSDSERPSVSVVKRHLDGIEEEVSGETEDDNGEADKARKHDDNPIEEHCKDAPQQPMTMSAILKA